METDYKDLKRQIADLKRQIADLKRKVASDPKGRFVPYIGVNYVYGLGVDGVRNNPRVLVIGPRHYCDAGYSSRNLLAYMSDQMREELREKCQKSAQDKPVTFPPDLKVGCVLDSPEDCLKDRHNNCPVYLAKGKKCPLRNDCKIMQQGGEDGGLPCNEIRNLRCETLYAIHEYLNNPSIESARLGLTYFDFITKFIIEEFQYKNADKLNKKKIWNKIAFMNLIQRYIPLKDTNFDSKKIGGHIDTEPDGDVDFCKSIIDMLKPDYIIMTMKCIKKALQSILSNGNDYEVHKAYNNLEWYVIKKRGTVRLPSRWESLCQKFLDDYELPHNSKHLGAEISNLVEVLRKDPLSSGESNKNKAQTIRIKILEILWNKLKDAKESSQKYKIKCLDYNRFNLDPYLGEKTMRKWIDNAHKRIHEGEINWTEVAIAEWIKDNR